MNSCEYVVQRRAHHRWRMLSLSVVNGLENMVAVCVYMHASLVDLQGEG